LEQTQPDTQPDTHTDRHTTSSALQSHRQTDTDRQTQTDRQTDGQIHLFVGVTVEHPLERVEQLSIHVLKVLQHQGALCCGLGFRV
jgi:hypothetical protein